MNNQELKDKVLSIITRYEGDLAVEEILKIISENFVPKDGVIESRHVKEYLEFLKSYPDFEKYPVKDISIDFCDSL